MSFLSRLCLASMAGIAWFAGYMAFCEFFYQKYKSFYGIFVYFFVSALIVFIIGLFLKEKKE